MILSMDKEKSPGHGAGGGLPPPSGRFSGCPPAASSFAMKRELSPAPSPPKAMLESTHFGHSSSHDPGQFSHDISGMPDFPPKNRGHRRAHSEILGLPDDISFDSDLGIVGAADGPSLSDEIDDDLFSMYMDMEKFASSSGATSGLLAGESSSGMLPLALHPNESMTAGPSEKPRVRHQHSLSMDGSTSIKPEMLVSGPEGASAAETKKAMSAAKLADLALLDPKRAKR